MSETYRIFLSSPNDVKAEKKALERVVNELNITHGAAMGYGLELVRWETHAAPGAGRPQQVITDLIGDYDIYIGVMWRRFGTPTGIAGSVTEEEFQDAYRVWERNRSVQLMFYFCQKPFMPKRIEELDQVRQVLLFRESLAGKALVWDYPTPSRFSDEIRKHLCIRINRIHKERQDGAYAFPPTEEDVINKLKALWPRMSPDLQKAMSIAYNENRRAGDGGVKTEDLFAALLREQTEPLKLVVGELPETALPKPIDGPVIDEPYIVTETPWLSPCVASSIKRLSNQLPEGRSLTSVDIFTDIAKHGRGESVRLLREHSIGPQEIDRILEQKNIDVVGV